uniref:Uncharacterized protein n=1 Tax=Amphimedon queenslandica TaxID=400682 RepID=A0A1X7UPB7_AMPQE
MRSLKADCPNILDKIHFKAIDGACNTIFWGLRKEGIGAEVKHTPIVTIEEEKQLWDSTILNIGKVCFLRGGEEQRNLKPSQFICYSNPDKYSYVKNGSKNRSGGIAQLWVQNKVVEIYAVPENEPRCLFYLLNF